jgi:hypothetical protein
VAATPAPAPRALTSLAASNDAQEAAMHEPRTSLVDICKLRAALGALVAGTALCACGVDVAGGADDAVGEGRAALRVIDAPALARGRRETLVTGIAAAENQLFSAAGRLYVSGDDGVFELSRSSAGATLAANPLVRVPGCKFGGMAEREATLYAVCYDGTDSYVHAAAETAAPAFQKIFKLEGIVLANGMATDGESLYVTATGQGSILRLRLDREDPLRISGREPFLESTGGLLPNGIKIRGGSVFWGDVGTIRRAPLRNPGNSTAPINAPLFFDDFWVGERVVLAADYLFGSVLAYTTSGTFIGGTPFFTFGNPSSVLEAEGRLGFGARDLIVTEKGTGSVAVFHY